MKVRKQEDKYIHRTCASTQPITPGGTHAAALTTVCSKAASFAIVRLLSSVDGASAQHAAPTRRRCRTVQNVDKGRRKKSNEKRSRTKSRRSMVRWSPIWCSLVVEKRQTRGVGPRQRGPGPRQPVACCDLRWTGCFSATKRGAIQTTTLAAQNLCYKESGQHLGCT